MALEQYRLIFSGERTGHYASIPLERHLKLLNLPDVLTNRALDGGKVSIKSGLSLQEMLEHKAKLLRLGVVTEHQIQLSPQILAIGLKPREQGKFNIQLPVNVLDSSLARTLLMKFSGSAEVMRLAKDGSVKADDPTNSLFVDWQGYQFGSLVSIGFAAFLTLTLQVYVISLAGTLDFGAGFQTTIGLVFLLLGIATLPKLIQPLIYLHVARDANDLEVFEQPEWLLCKRRFTWESKGASGEMVVALKKARLSSDKLLYEWSSSLSMESTGAAAVDEIRTTVTEGTILEPLQFAFRRVKTFLSASQADQARAFEDWAETPSSLVLDRAGDPVALIYDGDSLAYRIVRSELQQSVELHGFCIMILRRGLV